MNYDSYQSYSFFSNFADMTKFRIIMALQKKDMAVGEIAKELKEEQSKISHSLSKLASCHIVDVRKDGKLRIYTLNKKSVVPMLNIVESHIRNNCTPCCCYEKNNPKKK